MKILPLFQAVLPMWYDLEIFNHDNNYNYAPQVIVSVGVVCGILLVMISIFITVTGVVLWSKKKGL